ncbi:glycosyltransferase family protein [Aquirufa ecclesiirivi]|uniref:glycosyltransferase family protein n=1 Tax=Aquirufa ecclesiirivi TaxID=2715124 RepID=UPI0023D877E4|nr:glycosyltransferase family protein [Aquirufa ecclesiirivi]MDF0692495.1 glycosyltransferase family protein [Aquirufa ecclesiirivi]
MVKVIIITQARIGSTRFPNKVLKKIGEESLLSIHLNRLKKAKNATKIMVATTFEQDSDKIVEIAIRENVESIKGSTDDVLDRFYQAAKNEKPDFVVRVTSDCPLIDHQLIDQVIDMSVQNDLDYGANILVEEFPDGQDIEVVKWSALEKAWQEAKLPSDREHVTPYIRKNTDFNGGTLFKAMNFPANSNYNQVRMTVDEPADLDTIDLLITHLGTDKSWKVYADYILNNPKVFENQKIVRNEGYLKSLEKDDK